MPWENEIDAVREWNKSWYKWNKHPRGMKWHLKCEWKKICFISFMVADQDGSWKLLRIYDVNGTYYWNCAVWQWSWTLNLSGEWAWMIFEPLQCPQFAIWWWTVISFWLHAMDALPGGIRYRYIPGWSSPKWARIHLQHFIKSWTTSIVACFIKHRLLQL